MLNHAAENPSNTHGGGSVTLAWPRSWSTSGAAQFGVVVVETQISAVRHGTAKSANENPHYPGFMGL